MAQPFVSVPNVFTYIVRKVAGDASGESWTNTYHIKFPASQAPAIGQAITTAIAQYEQSIMRNDVFVEDVRVYPWQVGPSPIGHTPPLFTEVFHLLGNNPSTPANVWAGTGDPAAGNVTADLLLEHATGQRNGRKRYRGSLGILDLATTSAMQAWAYAPPLSGGTIPVHLGSKWEAFLGLYFGHGEPGATPQIGIVHTHKALGIIISASWGPITGVIGVGQPGALQIHSRNKR